MRANINCAHRWQISVYLNGVKWLNAMEADSDSGEILAAFADVNGKYVPEETAEKGSLICEGIKVARVSGEVKIEIDAPPELQSHFQERIEETFIPLVVTVKA